MTMMTPDRFIRALKRTPILLDTILCGITQERAAVATDGPQGWSVIAIVCHLRDFEEIFFNRAQQILAEERPELVAFDREQMAVDRDYANEDLNAAYEKFLETRQAFITWLEDRADEDWGRVGIHPEVGAYTLLEQAMQVPLHDLDHLEQIARCLSLPCDETPVLFGLAAADET